MTLFLVFSARAVVTATRAASGPNRTPNCKAILEASSAHFESCLKTLLNSGPSHEAGAFQLTGSDDDRDSSQWMSKLGTLERLGYDMLRVVFFKFVHLICNVATRKLWLHGETAPY